MLLLYACSSKFQTSTAAVMQLLHKGQMEAGNSTTSSSTIAQYRPKPIKDNYNTHILYCPHKSSDRARNVIRYIFWGMIHMIHSPGKTPCIR